MRELKRHILYLYAPKYHIMKFDLLQKDPQSKARAGVITTDHGRY
jgi:hypothetical protein